MALHADTSGRGPRLVLVHGFTQSRRCWGSEATDLARDHEVCRVDAPGHGGSADVSVDLMEAADLLADVGGQSTYLGYSMGARLCLHLGVQHPELARGLVLIGGTAGIADPAERAARRSQDETTARRLEAVGVEAFVDEWLAQPLFAGIPDDRTFLDERRESTVPGLASSLRLAGTGSQEPLWDRLASLTMPVLVVAGADDAKFSALGHQMAEAIGPNAELARIDGAGHAAHLERPDAFLAALRPWLADHAL